MSAVNFSGEDAKYLNLLQRIEFALGDNPNQFTKADLLRSKMNEIHHATRINLISKESSAILLDKYFTQYCAIVDSTDPAHGLNNYAEVALSLAERKKSENSKWTSGMTAESVRSSLAVKKLITKSKENKVELEKELSQIIQQSAVPGNLPKKVASAPTNPIKETNYNSNQTQTVRVVTGHVQSKFIPVDKLPNDNNVKRIKRKHDADEDNTDAPEGVAVPSTSGFRTARDQLMISEALKKTGNTSSSSVNIKYGLSKKSAGKQSSASSKFISPLLSHGKEQEKSSRMQSSGLLNLNDEKLCNIDPEMIEKIRNEIMDSGSTVTWDDIAGLEFAKKSIMEMVVWPLRRPDLFCGLRSPSKGLLLFGPPGTGKTLIGKCIACQSNATFFSISASSLTSKWIGDGEKMVRALFAVARCCQPSVIFIDEIDSLLTQRSDSEHESSRRLKTEFLVQFDGAATSKEDRLLVIGATNRPQELDEAARRRLVKRLYIPLPEAEARKQMIICNLKRDENSLTEEELDELCKRTDGYSGSDMAYLCTEAALGPMRSISSFEMNSISADQVRPIGLQDFLDALHQVKASVSSDDLKNYLDWNSKFGSTSRQH